MQDIQSLFGGAADSSQGEPRPTIVSAAFPGRSVLRQRRRNTRLSGCGTLPHSDWLFYTRSPSAASHISTDLATYSTYYGIPPPKCAVPDRQFASPCFQKADQRLSVAQLSGLSMHVLSGKLPPNGSVDSSDTCGCCCLMMKLPAPTVRMTVEGKDPEILLQTQAALILSVRF